MDIVLNSDDAFRHMASEEKKGHTPVVGFEWWGCLRSLGAAGKRKREAEKQ